MKIAKEKWEKKWIEAVVLSPSYLIFAVLVTRLHFVYWMVIAFFAQYFFGKFYSFTIVENRLLNGQFSREKMAVMLFLCQFFILSIGVLLASL